MQPSNRMMLNTMVMYTKYIINMVVVLFASRWVLLALGEEDFGIYNLVAGIIAMLMFLNITMASSTQRFLSYAVGTKDDNLIKETFKNSLIIHFFIGVVVFILFETIGLYSLHHILSVPEGKMSLAEFVLHCMSTSTFFTIVCVPFHAALLTHENILFISIIQVAHAVFKFIVAFILLYLSSDRLRIYAVSMMTLTILESLAFVYYVKKNYFEANISLKGWHNNNLMKKILAYSGWNLIGGISSVFRSQGVAMLLNSFFGVIINAAWGIAYQINGQLSFFSHAIVTATRPQIVKSEGGGNRERMLSLSMTTCKISFLLLSIFCIPLIIEMPYVLRIWLKVVPDYTTVFSRFILLLTLISQLSIGVSICVESVGNIKAMQIIVGGLHFLVIPVGFFLLRLGYQPYAVCIVMVLEEVLSFIFRIVIAHKTAGLPILFFMKKIVLPSICCVISVSFLCLSLDYTFEENFLRLCLVSLCSAASISLISYKLLLSPKEKEKIGGFYKSFNEKIKHHKS